MNTRYTPARAIVHIERRGKWAGITIDRIILGAAGPKQIAWASLLAACTTSACFDAGRRKTIFNGCGPIIWSFTLPNSHVDAVLEAIYSIESGDGKAALVYMTANRPQPHQLEAWPGDFTELDRLAIKAANSPVTIR